MSKNAVLEKQAQLYAQFESKLEKSWGKGTKFKTLRAMQKHNEDALFAYAQECAKMKQEVDAEDGTTMVLHVNATFADAKSKSYELTVLCDEWDALQAHERAPFIEQSMQHVCAFHGDLNPVAFFVVDHNSKSIPIADVQQDVDALFDCGLLESITGVETVPVEEADAQASQSVFVTARHA